MHTQTLEGVIIDNRDPQEIFEILDLLGQGAYGSVSKALHKPTGELVAIKIVPNSNDQINNIKKEIVILRDCNSEYVVKFYGAYSKDDNLWIVMEYCVAGSALDIIRITKRELNQYEIASILQAVLRGLEYLHANKIIHRDVKAGNVLLDHKGNAKLADFGVSAQIVNTNAQRKTFIGSPYWMSPEILTQSHYDTKTDIWSLGITAIELAEGNAPYSNMHPMRAMFVIRNKPAKGLHERSRWSEQFNSFVESCLHFNSSERLTARELLTHPFIVKKAKGKAILSELVLNSMDMIEKYRIKQSKQRYSEEQDGDSSLKMRIIEEKRDTIKMEGTIRRLDELQDEEEQVYDTGTLVIKDDEHSSSNPVTSPVLSEKNSDEPEFMKFAKRMREVDEVFQNKDKFLEYIEHKKTEPQLPPPRHFEEISKPVLATPPAKRQQPESAEVMIKKISQLDGQCQEELKSVLEKYRKRIDEQIGQLDLAHNRQYNRSELRAYNFNLDSLNQPSQLRRQPKVNEIRNINNINSINISITEKKVAAVRSPPNKDCSSCQKILDERDAFRKNKKFRQFVDDAEVFEYLKQNYMNKKK